MSTININGKDVDAQEFRNDWALALMRKGIIVRLTMSRWSGFTKIDPNDLGLKFSDDSRDFMKRYLSLGSERLLPPEIMNEITAIERRARFNLDAHSFDTIWGKFIPYHAFEDWESQNEQCKSMFFEFARGLSSKYSAITDIVRSEYRKLGVDVWHRLYPQGGEPTESFLTNFSDKIVQKIPSAVDIISSFRYESVFFVIPVPSIIQENVARAQNIEREQTIKNVNTEIEIRTKQRIAEEYVARKTELIDGFLNSTVVSMRKYIEELCQSVLESIGKSGMNDISKLNQRKILAMIDKVKLLNFYDDKDINNLLLDLKVEATKVKGERDRDVIVANLQKIVQVATEEFMPKDFNPSLDYLDVQ